MKKCPNCKSNALISFYKVNQVPVHSIMLMESNEEAVSFPKRDMELSYCTNCGFIHNSIFDPDIQEYNAKCEETQGFSPTFNRFHEALAKRLIKKHGLYDKTVLEIGCGKGDFISMLCELGNNKGYGFDPAFVPDRNPDQHGNVEFITDLYSEKYADYKADFVCCKMTLEHIPDTLDFLRVVRKAIGNNLDTTIFFQIPEAGRVLKDLGFWDVYYEHCSYFSPESLEYLFKRAGFDVLEVGTEYDDQYLMIEAKPSVKEYTDGDIDIDTSQILDYFEYFRDNIYGILDQWKALIHSYLEKGKKIVLWGGGSKAVAFMTTLGITDEIKYAVDINPYKHDHYLPGSGQKVIAPENLIAYQPDYVILMNPIYTEEVTKQLQEMDLYPEIIPVDFLSKEQLAHEEA
ncbi:MAG: class I SAM-dependent methyltransferase [Bacteroidota bacterium]